MAAPGPPQLPWLRLGPRLRSGLEVALRVPSLFLIDAIFNSAPLPGGSVCAALLGVLLRLLGETPSGPGGALGAAPGGPGRAGLRPRCSLGSPPPAPVLPASFAAAVPPRALLSPFPRL